MPLIHAGGAGPSNPLAVVEGMARANNWSYSRSLDDEVTLAVSGEWSNYQVSFSWMEHIGILHLACGFGMKIPPARLLEAHRLIASINEQLWIGHFDVWDQNSVVMFRHALLLIGGITTSAQQCEAVLGAALDSCERYYPALQIVVWAGKSAREAMDVAMLETVGEA
jgi:hypothetical protein